MLRLADFGYGLRRQIFFPLLGNGIFTQDGAAWKVRTFWSCAPFFRTKS